MFLPVSWAMCSTSSVLPAPVPPVNSTGMCSVSATAIDRKFRTAEAVGTNTCDACASPSSNEPTLALSSLTAAAVAAALFGALSSAQGKPPREKHRQAAARVAQHGGVLRCRKSGQQSAKKKKKKKKKKKCRQQCNQHELWRQGTNLTCFKEDTADVDHVWTEVFVTDTRSLQTENKTERR